MSENTWKLNSDGASLGNPGPGGAGAALYDPQGQQAAAISVYLGSRVTNNEAEYQGLILGLEKAVDLGAKNISIKMDSELIVRQLSGQYRVKHPAMKILYDRVQKILKNFDHHEATHVRREFNKEADALASRAAARGHNEE